MCIAWPIGSVRLGQINSESHTLGTISFNSHIGAWFVSFRMNIGAYTPSTQHPHTHYKSLYIYTYIHHGITTCIETITHAGRPAAWPSVCSASTFQTSSLFWKDFSDTTLSIPWRPNFAHYEQRFLHTFCRYIHRDGTEGHWITNLQSWAHAYGWRTNTRASIRKKSSWAVCRIHSGLPNISKIGGFIQHKAKGNDLRPLVFTFMKRVPEKTLKPICERSVICWAKGFQDKLQSEETLEVGKVKRCTSHLALSNGINHKILIFNSQKKRMVFLWGDDCWSWMSLPDSFGLDCF